jgi:hypothetical protein
MRREFMKVKNYGLVATIVVLLLFSLNIFAVESCQIYELTDVATSGDLASLMGKHRIFDVDLMMKYDDGVVLLTPE